MISIKHRRGDEAGWLDSDPIIPDGELALTRLEKGYDLKIGDGVTPYSKLPSFIGRSISSEEEYPTVTLSHLDDVRLSFVEWLEVVLDHASADNYTAILAFDTLSDTPISFDSTMEILFSGRDVEDGVFIPKTDMHYTLFFWKDGRMNCHVRGVSIGV
ncbi:MAG: hypothetical protein IKC32_04145 [Clostridia bacterium]|nr:hypothetical protein [Clostridia bacterium]